MWVKKQNQRGIWRCYVSSFEDRRSEIQAKKCRSALESGNGKGMDFLLERPESIESWDYFDFSLDNLILYFLPQKCNSKISFFKATVCGNVLQQ